MKLFAMLSTLMIESAFTMNRGYSVENKISVESLNMNQLNLLTASVINEYESQHPRQLHQRIFEPDRRLERKKRSMSCFADGKLLKFRKAFEKTFRSRMTYKQMKQLIDNHSICIKRICIACGENYVYSFEAKHRWLFLISRSWYDSNTILSRPRHDILENDFC